MEEMSRRRFVKTGAVLVLAVGAGVGIRSAMDAPESESPQMTMGEGMSKVLVVYGTKSGCTAGVAERIAKTLADEGATVDLVAADEAGSAGDYDAVVVGSGVRGGSWHEAARKWVADNAEVLKSRPTAFYTCGLTITQGPDKLDEVRAYTDPLIAETGVDPVEVGLFAGWNEPMEFTFVERTILKMMKAPTGDFRDWAAIDAWTKGVAPRLGLAA